MVYGEMIGGKYDAPQFTGGSLRACEMTAMLAKI